MADLGEMTAEQLRSGLDAMVTWAGTFIPNIPLDAQQQKHLLALLSRHFKSLEGTFQLPDRVCPPEKAPKLAQLRGALETLKTMWYNTAANVKVASDDLEETAKIALGELFLARWPDHDQVTAWLEDKEARLKVPPRLEAQDPLQGGNPGAVRKFIKADDLVPVLQVAAKEARIADLAQSLISAHLEVELSDGKLAGLLQALCAAGPPVLRLDAALALTEGEDPKSLESAQRLANQAELDLEDYDGSPTRASAAALIDTLAAAPRALVQVASFPSVVLRTIRKAVQVKTSSDLRQLVDKPVANAIASITSSAAKISPKQLAVLALGMEVALLIVAIEWPIAEQAANLHRRDQLAALKLQQGESASSLVARARNIWSAVRGSNATMLATDLWQWLGIAGQQAVEKQFKRTLKALKERETPDVIAAGSQWKAGGGDTTSSPTALLAWWTQQVAPTAADAARQVSLHLLVAIADEALHRDRLAGQPLTTAAAAAATTTPPLADAAPTTTATTTNTNAQPWQVVRGRTPTQELLCWGCGKKGHILGACPTITDQSQRQLIARAVGNANRSSRRGRSRSASRGSRSGSGKD